MLLTKGMVTPSFSVKVVIVSQLLACFVHWYAGSAYDLVARISEFRTCCRIYERTLIYIYT